LVVQRRLLLQLRKLDPETLISTRVLSCLTPRGYRFIHIPGIRIHILPESLFTSLRNPYSHGPEYALGAATRIQAGPPARVRKYAASTYYIVYMSRNSVSRGPNMRRTAKIFMNNRNQAVRLPKEFQFNTREVFIRKEGSDVILSPRPMDGSSYLANGPVASEDFMEGVEDLPVQEREP
jgi:antitoxin VapB